ncbi:deoxyribonuclease-2-alpha isoform X3 [Triplophysa dalaica]|uniref:deoxyribonuclease-2-alpha isoform X2 n=1 Tax=Triplophysa dalaica TaxID=1582913 RepID=UPI0024E002BF|nr:deoxyribonuclease-2-alpha isoform X2 [Triplophysa dalaica]XP_056619091.1 deoxyribonuclease-2-alpha isoform X2 [Triplophysa dalaica]XP_056619092.1 deoxyribonuclease-2-alpha isoform X2 [Triplophysa dalaica]XP_056619093.1 deoxyribonuclease-2-alpha isoform X2 [Triplophysa dalaica]XP_056619094.1 deoxyribonuclease-2-alpha isoform X3 [Triplophysa dalaica]
MHSKLPVVWNTHLMRDFCHQREMNRCTAWDAVLKKAEVGSFISIMLVHVLLLLLHVCGGGASPIQCSDDQGKPVDWFYLYKLPHPHRTPAEEGLKYLYMDAGSEGWADGKTLINDTQSAVGRTLAPLYEGGDVGYILYNDQPPQKKNLGAGRTCGHTKGVVVFDKQQGFWLVHSTPHFPPPKTEGGFSYPSSGINNGQNFICVTYPFERFQTIGEQLNINQPHIYDCSIPASLAAAVPAMAQLCKHTLGRWENASSSPANRSISLLSLAGSEFISFAKGASFDNDLYHSWVAPTLQSNLLVQFWRRSTGILPSDCSQNWKVLNVDLISPGQRVTFKATADHSKWAISTDGGHVGTSGSWVCVGDINRDEAEEKRGGGTVCHRDAVVWKAYRTAALQCETCDGKVQTCDKAVMISLMKMSS